MTRPFAVTGFTIFTVMLVLYYAGIGFALPACIFFTAGLAASLIIRAGRRQRVLPLSAAAGVVSCLIFMLVYQNTCAVPLSYAGRNCEMKAVITENMNYTSGRYRFNAQVLEADGKEVSFRARLSFRDMPDFEAGDVVEGKFSVYSLADYSDRVKYTDSDSGACIGAYPADYLTESIAETGKMNLGVSRFARLREALRSNITDYVPGVYGKLANAILLGRESDFPEEIKSAFSNAGVSHVICVSGLHLTILAMFIRRLLSLAGLKRRLSALISALFVLGYMALTGFTYSVTRAGVMMLTLLLGQALSRRSDSLNSLGLAATVILLFDPLAAGDTGLQLSFSATLGIILLMPYFGKKLGRLKGKAAAILSYPAKIILTTVCAAAFSLPFTLLAFGSINLFSFAGNLMVIPLVTVTLVSSAVTALAPFVPVVSLLAYPAGALTAILTRAMIKAVGLAEGLGFLTFYPEEKLMKIWLGGALLIAAVSILHRYMGHNSFRIAGAVIAAAFLCMNIVSYAFTRDITEITVIDIGNASAVLVTKGGRGALIGCGEDDFNSSYLISSAVRSKHLDSLDLMLLPRTEKSESGSTLEFIKYNSADVIAYTEKPLWLELVSGEAECVCFDGRFTMPLWEGCRVTCDSGESGGTVLLETDCVRTLCVFKNNPVIPREFTDADFLICRQAVPAGLNAHNFDAVVLAGTEKALFTQNSLIEGGIDAAASGGNGNVTLSISENGKYSLGRQVK